MVFNSLHYMIFFPVSIMGFYLIPPKIRYIWLLICSYYFYMSWNPVYSLLILLSTVCTYTGSIIVYESINKKSRVFAKKILIIVIFINIAILIFFKYSNFLLSIIYSVCEVVKIQYPVITNNVLLPVGISFYTFQALGYTIDVYRGKIAPEKSFLKYALYVSFFPQLVAGPIERSENLLPQIQNMNAIKFDLDRTYKGLMKILWGLFLKMVIADRVAVLVDNVYGRYYTYGSIELIVATIFFGFQLYCDFMSYSTIAVGSAEILGFNLINNFDAPYTSMSVKEFWRRWHISLSSWFKEYVYIPFGGNRKGRRRTYINLMITFLLSGLWHGASLTFVIWGGLHGIFQIIESILEPLKNKIIRLFHIDTECFSYKLFRMIKTLIIVDFAWIFFRSVNIKSALSFIKRIFVDFDPWIISTGGLFELGIDRIDMNILLLALIILVISDCILRIKKISIVEWVDTQNAVFKLMFIGFIFAYIFIFGAYGPVFDAKQFIYFQF